MLPSTPAPLCKYWVGAEVVIWTHLWWKVYKSVKYIVINWYLRSKATGFNMLWSNSQYQRGCETFLWSCSSSLESHSFFTIPDELDAFYIHILIIRSTMITCLFIDILPANLGQESVYQKGMHNVVSSWSSKKAYRKRTSKCEEIRPHLVLFVWTRSKGY